MRGVRGDLASPGEFRRSQNWIGGPGSTPATASYVPPPPDGLLDCMGDRVYCARALLRILEEPPKLEPSEVG